MEKTLIKLCALLLLVTTARAAFGEASPYINWWAVKVHGGWEEAERVALKHGFQLHGKVGELKDMYQFAMGSDFVEGTDGLKMDTMPRSIGDTYINKLKLEPSVGLVIQQCLKKRSKRTAVMPTDPKFDLQWYLLNTGQFNASLVGRDHRVQRVWLQGVTGCSIIVAIVDDGVEYTHPDLLPNYAYSLGYDYIHGGGDAFPSYAFYSEFPLRESHGTGCAGIIAAARDNGVCGVGGAYDATITGLNLLGFESEDLAVDVDMAEGGALSHNNDIIDIYSNSWGPEDSGFIVEGPDVLAKMALEMGAKEGRDGKGVVFTFAAGNGGEEDDSCAADGYTNIIYTISVGAVGVDGKPASYDEICSAKLVSAYVENFQDSLPKVTTTSTLGSCTEEFDGTSAATPIMSSIVALTLETNYNLTWRDIQYLIVYTSNTDDYFQSSLDEWRTNGAGLRYSHQFGFGVADAEAMVTRARHWVNVPQQYEDTVEPQTTSGMFDQMNEVNVIFTYGGDISFLEHVVVKTTLSPAFNSVNEEEDFVENMKTMLSNFTDTIEDVLPIIDILSGPKRGDIQVELLSPMGTHSILLPFRNLDNVPYQSLSTLMSVLDFPPDEVEQKAGEGYIDWPFMSVHFWGEDPRGEWTLKFLYRGNHSATFEDLNVTFHGTVERPEAVVNYSECHSACSGGCARGGGSEFCHSCRNLRHAETLECIDECPPDFELLNGYCYDPSRNDSECLKFPDAPPQGSCRAAGFDSCCVSGDGETCKGSERSCSCDQDCFLVGDCCADIACICQAPLQDPTLPYMLIVNASGIVPSGDTVNVTVFPPFGFPFGASFYFSIYVQEDGVFSLGATTDDTFDPAFVFPFWSDADTSNDGRVTYWELQDGPELHALSEFISTRMGVVFRGTWALLVDWRDIPKYVDVFAPSEPERNTFQGALVTDGFQSYAVFTYRCGDLQWDTNTEQDIVGNFNVGVGFYGVNASQVHRIVGSTDVAQEVACANSPNEWNNFVYPLTEESVECYGEVDEFGTSAILFCSDPPFLFEDIICILPTQEVNCSVFPVSLDVSNFLTGDTAISIVGHRGDNRIFLGKASIILPEIDLYFTGNTPRVDADSVHVEFASNREGLDMECHLIGMDKVDCSNGVFPMSGLSPGRHVLRIVARDRARRERKVLRSNVNVQVDPEFCRPYTINRGWRVEGNNFTLEFSSTGSPTGFLCTLDRLLQQDCQSPLVLEDLEQGLHHVRVTPLGCAGGRHVWSKTFLVDECAITIST